MQLTRITVLRMLSALAALALGGGCSSPADPPVVSTIEISPSDPVLHEFGETVRMTATVKDQYGEVMTSVPVTWSSHENFAVLVSEDGLVTATEPGRVSVRASAAAVTESATILVEPGPRLVLHKFYRMMEGDDWERNTGWKTDAPLDRWFGVSTNGEGSIEVLFLPNNGLVGEIPREVGSLSSLVGLTLAQNLVTGEIPPELGSLQNLQYLVLASNQLAGEIPSELGDLQNLQYLDLSQNQLTGSIPPELGKLQRLWILYLQSNQLSGPVPGELGSMSTLISLIIAHNPLSGTLPRDLMQLSLGTFHWNDTSLCAPTDIAFQHWLNSIGNHRGNTDC